MDKAKMQELQSLMERVVKAELDLAKANDEVSNARLWMNKVMNAMVYEKKDATGIK